MSIPLLRAHDANGIQVVAGIKVLEKEAIMTTEAEPFLIADKWLAGRR